MKRTVETRDGATLVVQVTPAVGEPQGRVLAVHAMGVDARTLDRPRGRGLVSELAAAGLEVWNADLRGHGPSVAPSRSWTYDDLVRYDLPALVGAARRDGWPLTVLGHSLGAHVTCAAVAEGVVVDALVLIAPNVWRPSHEPSLRRRFVKSLAMNAFEATALAAGRFPTRRLKVGTTDEALPYVRDLVRFWRQDRWASRDGTAWSAGLAGADLPVLAVAGQGDRLLTTPEAARRFCDAFPPGVVDFWLEQQGHGGLSFDPDHMGLVCDERSRPTWTRIAGWIRRYGRGSRRVGESLGSDGRPWGRS